MKHPIVTHFAVVLAVLASLLLGGAVVNHIHDSFEGVSTGLDKPQSDDQPGDQSGATSSTPKKIAEHSVISPETAPSMSPDDRVFLEQALDCCPVITGASTAANLLELGTAIRDACAAGVTTKQMIADVNRKNDPTLPPVEVGNLIRLAVAVYCTPVNGSDRVSRNGGERA